MDENRKKSIVSKRYRLWYDNWSKRNHYGMVSSTTDWHNLWLVSKYLKKKSFDGIFSLLIFLFCCDRRVHCFVTCFMIDSLALTGRLCVFLPMCLLCDTIMILFIFLISIHTSLAENAERFIWKFVVWSWSYLEIRDFENRIIWN